MVEVEVVSGGAGLSEESPCQWQWENEVTNEKINRKKKPRNRERKN